MHTPHVTGRQQSQTSITKTEGPSDKGTPAARSVRKAKGLGSRDSQAAEEENAKHSRGTPTCRKEAHRL